MARGRDSGLVSVGGTGGGCVGDGVGGKNNGLRRDRSGLRKGWCRGARKATLGFRQRGDRGREKMMVFLALNRATSRRSDATSRRSREESSLRRDVGIQRCDVPKTGKNQRRDVDNQRRDVPGKCKTNVATLRSNVATFQRRSNPTSRR